jgi:hypothetical protein
MIKRMLVLLFVVSCATDAFCQTSAYQDTDGNTSIYLQDAKTSLVYNVSDAKFTIGYLTEPVLTRQQNAAKKLEKDLKDATTPATKTAADREENNKLVNELHDSKWANSQVGLHFSGKPSTDLRGQILQSSSSPASVSGGAYYGVHGLGDRFLPNLKSDDWLTVNFDYTRSTFNTVPTASASPISQHFNGFTVMPSWNILWNFIPGVTLLSGVSAGVNRTNNTGNLSKVEIDTTLVTSGSVSVVKQKDAYLGAYTASVGVPIYSDFAFIPRGANWLSIDAFERANVVSSARYTEGGVGIFIARPSKPTDVLGGISIGWKNGQSTIAVVAGWSF